MLLRLDTEIIPRARFMGYINYRTPWIHFPRLIDEYVLYVMHEGEMFIEEGNNKFHLIKGEYLLLEPNIPHRGYEKACCDYYYIHFSHPGLSAVTPGEEQNALQAMILQRNQSLACDNWVDTETDPTDTISYIKKHAPLLNINVHLLTLGRAVDNFYHRAAHGKRSASLMLSELLIDISRENSYVENAPAADRAYSLPFMKVQSILRFINSNYVQKITSTDIEEKFSSNFDYLNRIFSKMTGYTIFSYINKVRLGHSKELIETTPLSIAEIAYLVGIDDSFYFSKLFKKFYGMPPSQYARMVNRETRRP